MRLSLSITFWALNTTEDTVKGLKEPFNAPTSMFLFSEDSLNLYYGILYLHYFLKEFFISFSFICAALLRYCYIHERASYDA